MPSGDDLTHLRREYLAEPLGRSNLHEDPVQQFRHWFAQALELSKDDANSMVLATANAEGAPAARIVLLKHYSADGFCWYTDYESAKGQDLLENPQAELLFYWPWLERQVRIAGKVSRLDRAHAEQYFSQRPRGSQLSAAASHQSRVVMNREELEGAVTQLSESAANAGVECPQRWGGYCLQPERYEFWQGRPNRLHDRFVYKAMGSEWSVERLAP